MSKEIEDMTNIEVCGKIDHLEERLNLFEKNYDNKFDEFNIQFTKLYNKVYGNGNEGMLITLALLNEKIDKLIAQTQENCLAIKELSKLTPESWLGKNWKTILFVGTAFFLILHSIIPSDLSMWAFLSKILGGG